MYCISIAHTRSQTCTQTRALPPLRNTWTQSCTQTEALPPLPSERTTYTVHNQITKHRTQRIYAVCVLCLPMPINSSANSFSAPNAAQHLRLLSRKRKKCEVKFWILPCNIIAHISTSNPNAFVFCPQLSDYFTVNVWQWRVLLQYTQSAVSIIKILLWKAWIKTDCAAEV